MHATFVSSQCNTFSLKKMLASLLYIFVLGVSSIPNISCKVGTENKFLKKDDARTEEERIVDGQSAQEGQFPWAAALFFEKYYACTASIISDSTILTAAHCVVNDGESLSADILHVIIGNVNRFHGGTRVNISSITVYPEYYNTGDTDIAFLTTSSPITFNSDTAPICIAKTSKDINQFKLGTAMGWGLTSKGENATAPDILQYADLNVVDQDVCKLQYPGSITDNEICAEGGRSGVCFGDSGGPLVSGRDTSSPLQIGVASFISGKYGCEAYRLGPGVFTRVTSFADWLLSNDENICAI